MMVDDDDVKDINEEGLPESDDVEEEDDDEGGEEGDESELDEFGNFRE